MKYKFETHCHTSQVSRCAHVEAEKVVEAYIKSGYSGIAITDHFSFHTFADTEHEPWDKLVDTYLEGWRTAKKAAGNDLTVLLGMELTFRENANDYLVYGVTEKFLLDCKGMLEMGINAFSKKAKENGLIIFQAHPFRNGMTVTNPQLIDGIEAFNANPRHDSRNDIAFSWADKFGLKKSSGSDFHEYEDIARGGILTKEKIVNNDMLIDALMNDAELILIPN